MVRRFTIIFIAAMNHSMAKHLSKYRNRLSSKRITFSADIFTLEVLKEDQVNRFSMNMKVDDASNGWITVPPTISLYNEEDESEGKIQTESLRINAKVGYVNNNNSPIKRFCY